MPDQGLAMAIMGNPSIELQLQLCLRVHGRNHVAIEISSKLRGRYQCCNWAPSSSWSKDSAISVAAERMWYAFRKTTSRVAAVMKQLDAQE
jgi:hypothetical protein